MPTEMKKYRFLALGLIALLAVLVLGPSATYAKDVKFKVQKEKSYSSQDDAAFVVFIDNSFVAPLIRPSKGTPVYLRLVPCRGKPPVVVASMNSPPATNNKKYK